MKNVAVVINEFGTPEVLKLDILDVPVLSSHDVLVKIEYSTLNPIDAKTRQGKGWGATVIGNDFPAVLGIDFSGVIVKCGECVDQNLLNRKIVGWSKLGSKSGSYQTYKAVNKEQYIVLDPEIKLDQAASLPVAGLTAYQAIKSANLNVNDRVMVLGASGGCGHFTVQIANDIGCYVIAVCSEQNLDFVSALGAQEALDYKLASLSEQASSVDVLIDLVGGDAGLDALKCVKSSGTVITVPSITADEICEKGSEMGLNVRGMLVDLNISEIEFLLTKMKQKKIHTHIDNLYKPKSIKEAHSMLESSHTKGKLLLDMTTI